MKKLSLITAILLGSFTIFSFTGIDEITEGIEFSVYETKFDEGFKDGHCEGFKDVKGEFSICPVPPVTPIPKVGQSYDSYKDGYNTGFKRGMRDARKY
tara:strand:+ start:162 stop:455 length:294 start_codon:yes stop_codon:yes gene_type:complete